MLDMSAKPFTTLEAAAASMARTCVESHIAACVVFSASGLAAERVAKFRPQAPLVVITESNLVAGKLELLFGAHIFMCDLTSYGWLECIQMAIEALSGRIGY